MARPLTEKQEAFCRAFVETGNASEAYRRSYDAKNMGQNTIAVKASEMLNKDNISVRLQQLREVHQKRHNVTVDSLVAELEEIKNVALSAETPQSSAAVAAVLGKAKLMGLDKQLVQLSGGLDNVNTNINITAEDVRVFKKAFDDEF